MEKGLEDDNCDDKSKFFSCPKREFKIFDKKIREKNYASNRIYSSSYSLLNFVPYNLTQQF